MTTTALSEVLAEIRENTSIMPGKYWADRIESALASAEPVLGWANPRDVEKVRRPRSKRDGSALAVFIHGEQSEDYSIPIYTHAKPAAKVEARYECRECGSCGHAGINDASTTQSACFSCEWSGPEPGEDKCPGCGEEGCMTAACPECGARYRFVAELEAEPPGKTPASVPGGLTDQTLPDGCEPAGTRGIHPIR